MLASHERLAKIPVIMLTGNCDQDTIRRCYNMCAYFVPKCPDVWPRVEPLLYELLDVDAPPPATNTATAATAADHLPQRPETAAASSSQANNKIIAASGRDEIDNENPGGQHALRRRSPCVLCIDDDSDFSFGLKLRLQEHGVEMLRAFDSIEGYRYAFTSPPEAIILDHKMPGGDGDYVLRRLKENPVTQDIPVIVLTGHRDRALERTMYNLGAARFLIKPIAWDALWSELRRYVDPCPTVARRATRRAALATASRS
jgi:CheY-like chemotaxis protein